MICDHEPNVFNWLLEPLKARFLWTFNFVYLCHMISTIALYVSCNSGLCYAFSTSQAKDSQSRIIYSKTKQEAIVLKVL